MVKRGIQYKGMFLTVFNKIKKTALKRGIEFSITMEEIGDLFENQNGKCALSGITLTLKKNTKDTTQTASLDRKDSKKGYMIENLQWIHKDLNKLKSDFSQEEFIEMCLKVTLYMEAIKMAKKYLEYFNN
jgi:hypothetical protein